MSPIVGLTPFVLSMASPRVQPTERITVSEIMQAARVSSNHTVIIDIQHLEKQPSSTILSWLQGVAQTRGFAIHLLRKGQSQSFRPKALPLPDIEIPQDLARVLLEDMILMQGNGSSGRTIAEIYGETATDALLFLMNRFPEAIPEKLDPDEEIPADLARPLLESVFKLLQHDPSGQRVANTYGDRALASLYVLMKELPDLLPSVVMAFGYIGSPRTGFLVTRLLGHGDPLVRRVAAQALGRMHVTGACEDLWNILSNDGEHSRVRREAAAALGLLGQWDMPPRLAALLEAESHCTRLVASLALGWHSIPMGFLRSDSEKGRQWAAMLQDVIVPALVARLKDTHNPVIAQAAWSLGKLKAQRCLPELEALESHPDWAVRWRVKGAVIELRAQSV